MTSFCQWCTQTTFEAKQPSQEVGDCLNVHYHVRTRNIDRVCTCFGEGERLIHGSHRPKEVAGLGALFLSSAKHELLLSCAARVITDSVGSEAGTGGCEDLEIRSLGIHLAPRCQHRTHL